MSSRFDWRNPSHGLVILFLALASIGLGFFGDFVLTCLERNAYPCDYSEYVSAYAEKYGVPEELVYAVIRTESDFDSGAVSSAGAVGLMQLMPSTFKWLTDEILFDHLESGMLYDPETNIRYGTYYLSALYDRYGDWELALAAYNGGLGNVDKWLADDRYADGEGGLKKIPFRETRQFVKRVTAAREKYEKLYSK
jgi:soluble lytic murein transglycosylase